MLPAQKFSCFKKVASLRCCVLGPLEERMQNTDGQPSLDRKKDPNDDT